LPVILAVVALLAPMLLAAPSVLVASSPVDPLAAVQPVPRLEILVLSDGWVLRVAEPLTGGWAPPLDEHAARRLGPGRAYIPAVGAASERVLFATALELLRGGKGVLQLRAGDRVAWRELVRSAEILAPLRLASDGLEVLDGVLVDVRPNP
jgi:hypothetical protein